MPDVTDLDDDVREKLRQAEEQIVAQNEQLRLAYAQWFATAPPVVLQDLQKFCRARTSAFHSDPRMHAVLEGRREVWFRIHDFATLDLATLMRERTQQQ